MNKINVILDTTFVLPLFGIRPSFEEKNINEIKSMWEKGINGFNLILPDVCLIESFYKLNREYRKKKDTKVLERYYIALPSIVTSKTVTLQHILNNVEVAEYLIKLRLTGHNDFFDCIIGAQAIDGKGLFITEDEPLKKAILSLNEEKKIEVNNWKEFSKNYPI